MEVASHSSGEFSIAAVKQCIERGTHLGMGWATDDNEVVGLVVVNTTQHENFKALSVVGAAGAATDYQELHKAFNQLAIQMGCEEFEIRGRRGFARKFREFGWYEKHVIIGCKVTK